MNEEILHAFARLGRTFHVRIAFDLCGDLLARFGRHGPFAFVLQLARHLWIVSQIFFTRHENHRTLAAEVSHFRHPFLHHARRRHGTVDAETDQHHAGVGIGEWPQSIVVFLAGGVEQREIDLQTQSR